MTDVELLLLYSNLKLFNCVPKIWTQACLKMLSTKCVYKSYLMGTSGGVMVKKLD